MSGTQHGISGCLKCARDLQEPLFPLPGLPLSQTKEMGHPTSPGLASDEELRDAFGKVRDKVRDGLTSFPVAV